MAKNMGVIERLKKRVGMAPLKTSYDSQLAGAIGAALFGFALCRKDRADRASK
jgi:benzoyl-CoA reductase subunit A